MDVPNDDRIAPVPLDEPARSTPAGTGAERTGAPATGPGGWTAPPALRRWTWLAILVLGVVAYVIVLRTMVATQNINFFPSLLLIGAITVPMSVLVFAVEGGRVPPVHVPLVTFVAIVGGLAGTVTAGILEYSALRRLGTVPMITVGLAEESAKLVVPFLVFLVVRPHDPRHGVVIGIASGMGFATLETMGYGFQTLLAARSIAAVDSTLLLRGLLSPACHIAWTGMVVAMLWRIPSARRRGRAVLAFVGTFVTAVLLHATWDGSTSVAVHLVIATAGVAVLLWFVHVAHRRRPAAPATPTTFTVPREGYGMA